MKRKGDEQQHGNGSVTKKRAISDEDAQQCFRDGLFADQVADNYANSYGLSKP